MLKNQGDQQIDAVSQTWHEVCVSLGMTAQKTKILLVDDDSGVLEALGRALASENYEIVAACNSGEALSGFVENKIDVALLDMNLGAESGWDVSQRLTDLKPHLPILLMTGTPDCPSSMSGVTCLEKPLDFRCLLQKLSAICATNPEPVISQ